MNLYDIFMCPLEKFFLNSMRKHLIYEAGGKVLEIGAGTGVNFEYYNMDGISDITVVDKQISNAVRKKASDKMQLVEADASKLPFEDNTFDTVVETLLLCSIDELDKPLSEIHRVLKPDGVFIHIDHGLPEGKGLKKIVNGFAPVWRSMSKSCRINKTYKPLLEKAGFDTSDELSSGRGIFYGGISSKK